ncbi:MULTISPECIES: polysaccharide deacetylase family protein [Methylocaldum]|jgi:peptidoglycan/xylan/chitin deacetylase (PgdA/CDA1 family)|uniref:polysaccharide deacetylase family protein n=1 Tax=unclassified Methylocaldum TaxID=2622260 RepID=UPI000A326BE2|nr:polysaccharide deacetylase family protein [Methylocaldum sp. RMAD-M]MBP1150914.1 peptidoglycan/xylan/chitin deacetylase (PgdA/CDA1 family) [Methylocaldum sp. RMAD-M]MVF21063.1 polysaccharide deacetylase family protein [Methylocaldum sp. BRCS4]
MHSVRHWLPSPFLRYSAAFQVIGGSAALLAPDGSTLLVEALAANHAIVFGASFWPTSPLLGPNLTRLPAERAERKEIALTFDDGPDIETTPKVLDLLDRYQAKASFFCIAARAEKYPELVRDIVSRGHRIENHTYRHAHTFALSAVGGFKAEIGRAQAALTALTGASPRYFRAPVGMRNPWLQPVLSSLDLTLVSWTRRGYDAVFGDPQKIVRRLSKNLRGGDILLLHDGSSARDRNGRPVVLEALPRLLDEVARLNLIPVPL